MTAEVRPALLILLAAVALLFLASTASLVVLQLSRVRDEAGRSPFARRSAPERARLVRQWLVESALLGLIGGASGVLIATVLHRGLPAGAAGGLSARR